MKALIVNGPNLNMLGKRNHTHYGSLTLDELNELIKKTYPSIDFEFVQSNSEAVLIDLLQTNNNYDFILMNPGAFAHYSIALRDAFETITKPKGICHLSDIKLREEFRHNDLFEVLSDVYVKGLKEQSYLQAIEMLTKKI
ncbi:MAG TPA: 3-dehydroquinate dehydratase [Acholeplasmataceae bacterium]|nr:3-dehydroquinate dehydratase [Acholeplasmataceae bacterium]